MVFLPTHVATLLCMLGPLLSECFDSSTYSSRFVTLRYPTLFHSLCSTLLYSPYAFKSVHEKLFDEIFIEHLLWFKISVRKCVSKMTIFIAKYSWKWTSILINFTLSLPSIEHQGRQGTTTTATLVGDRFVTFFNRAGDIHKANNWLLHHLVFQLHIW